MGPKQSPTKIYFRKMFIRPHMSRKVPSSGKASLYIFQHFLKIPWNSCPKKAGKVLSSKKVHYFYFQNVKKGPEIGTFLLLFQI